MDKVIVGEEKDEFGNTITIYSDGSREKLVGVGQAGEKSGAGKEGVKNG